MNRRSLAAAVVMVGVVSVMTSNMPAQVSQPATWQGATSQPTRAVRLDAQGVIRWTDTGEEVALFGANYCLPSACDFRAAGYVNADRKKLIEQDMAHFARMGWDGLRLCLWGDYQNSDRDGNLVVNEHLDLLDYLIFQARQRGISMLFTPMVTYSSQWPDAMQVKADGFSEHFQKRDLGTDDKAIAAQVNYLKQVLNHVNPYTGVALKDEPSILFIEMINEPWHHSKDVEGSVRYINALVDAVRSTGCNKLTFHNLSQDFGMAEPIRRSKVDGVSFAWYPSGLNSGRTLQGNYLRMVDAYPEMLRAEIKSKPRIVYEFDEPDLLTPYMYPAMVRTYRSVGTQFAAIFSYDMLETAPYNLGWQTHFVNLVATPKKAVGAIIAAEAMRALPRYQDYGKYPDNTRFGNFRVSYEEDLAEMVTPQRFYHAGSTRTEPPDRAGLRKIVGFGSSPVVAYEGEGAYFLDKLDGGVWRLEVYPDALLVSDPFVMPSPQRLVVRIIHRAWPMKIAIPDLGETFRFERIAGGGNAGGEASGRATSGKFAVTPGVFILTRNEKFDRATLPKRFGNVGLDEYHVPAAQPPSPPHVEPRIPTEIEAGASATFAARVVTADAPDDVLLFIRPAGTARFRKHAMKRTGGYDYAITLDGDAALKEGLFECCISVVTKETTLTVPGQVARKPDDWDFYGTTFSTALVTPLRAPRKLFTPARDVPKLAFSRIGDGGRRGIFRTVAGRSAGEAAFHLEMPIMNGWSPKDYTASLTIKDRIVALEGAVGEAKSLNLNLRALGEKQVLHVTFVERDGASWSAEVIPGSDWTEVSIPLAAFKPERGVMLPQGFPGDWNYWIDMPAGRGGGRDALRPRDIERLQFSVRTPPGEKVVADPYGFEIESAALDFTTAPAGTDAATRAAAAVTPELRYRVAQRSRAPLVKHVNHPSAGG